MKAQHEFALHSRLFRWVSLLALGWALAGSVALGQAGLTTASPDAPALTIESVEIRFVDLDNLTPEIALANLRARRGMAFSQTLIDQDVRTLYETGLFEGIEVKRSVEGAAVRLVYELRPKYRIGRIAYAGNKRISSRRLEREVKIQSGGPLDERQINSDAQALFEFYQKAGFSQVKVDYEIDRNRQTGRGDITFRIAEGERVRIARIEFTGNENVRSRALRGEMETSRWNWLYSWLTGGGRLKDDTFDEDLEKLRDYYRERGYLDVAIEREQVQFDYPKPDRLVLRIPVSEGRRYRVGQITMKGNSLFPTMLLQRLLRVRPGDVFVPSKLDDDVESVRDFYGRDGYLETNVRLIRRPNLETGDIDIEYDVRESGRFQVESVRIDGNTKTKSTVVARELVLSPGETFDTVRMKISQQRLKNTRFFEEDVTVTPETINIPDRKNLKVQLREGRTGGLSFGAGFSSLEQAVVFAEITQSNFDLFNWRSFFQGDGQKFRLRFQIGSESNEATLNFEEPWLFERELALGFQIYRQRSDIVSDFYDEIRAGFEVYLRKRLFELVEGRIAYRWETTDIELTPDDTSNPFFFSGGSQATSRVAFSLERDTRDTLISTRRGNRVQIFTEVVGGFLGGDEDFYRLEGRVAQFFPIFEWQKQALALQGRAGVVQAYGRNAEPFVPVRTVETFEGTVEVNEDGETRERHALQVPIYERYYLGGPNTLRGFEFRDISPRDRFGEVIGGKTQVFFSAEYSIDIVSPIRFAIFYDAGYVNSGGFDFAPAGYRQGEHSGYHDNWGFGLRILVLGAPLNLDYGIPITSNPFSDRGNQFNFSFGTQF